MRVGTEHTDTETRAGAWDTRVQPRGCEQGQKPVETHLWYWLTSAKAGAAVRHARADGARAVGAFRDGAQRAQLGPSERAVGAVSTSTELLGKAGQSAPAQ